MSEKVRVGIAGLGRSGWRIHSNILDECSVMYQVVAIFDPIKERCLEAVHRFGCRDHDSFYSLLEDKEVELIVIATPSHLHASNTIDALKAGKMVVCEKPMATNLDEADAMIETARKTGNLLTIFHNMRYDADFIKVKEIIESGRLGRIVEVKISDHNFGRRWDWQTLKKFGGGELRNNGSHMIDRALQLLGKKEPDVFCDLQRTLSLGDADDHFKIIMRASGAPLIDLELTHSCAFPQNNWLVMGTCGGLSGTTSSLCWKYFNPEDLPPREVDEEPTSNRSYNQELIPWKEESWNRTKNYKGTARECDVTFYKQLYETIRRGAPLSVTPESARRVMWIIQKCHEA